jgi:hypothetical protein
MPAAIAIPLVLGAATGAANIVGAKMASNASKKAAQTQADAGTKAIQMQQAGQDKAVAALDRSYGQAAGLFDPYRQLGLNALPNVQRLAGSGYPGGGMPQPYQMPGNTPQAMPQGLSRMGQQAPAAMSQPQGLGQSGTVLMRAPNGTTSPVPMAQVEHYKAKGAQVVQ